MDSTDTSSQNSSISTSRNDSIGTVLHNDKVRYQRKGYGLIMAVIIFIIYFTFAPILLKSVWPFITSIAERTLVQAFLTICFPLSMIVLGNVMMYFIYVYKVPFFERYRINNKPWPWEEDQKQWKITFNKFLKQTCFNYGCVLAPAILIDIYVIGSHCRFGVDDFPEYQEILLHVLFMMIMEDFSFYWAHRTIHIPFLYKRIHKIHHEFNQTVSIASIYAHPLEYFFGNSIPTALGFMILGKRCHYATYMMWIIIRVFETIDGHCGYEFSWSPYRLLPLSGSSEYHSFHHSHNVGTFGSFFTFWDTIFGTNKDYYQYKSKKEKEDALNVLRSNYKGTAKIE